jgi:hypothetical protein
MLSALTCSTLGLNAGSAVVSRSAVGGQRSAALFMQEDAAPPAGWQAVKEDLWSADKKADIRIEGGKTLKTFAMPSHAERVQYILTSPNGRPVKAKVELWIGPNRCVHGEHTHLTLSLTLASSASHTSALSHTQIITRTPSPPPSIAPQSSSTTA